MINNDQLLFDRAVVQMQHGNYFGAIETIRQALTGNPDSPRAHALLAVCLHNQKRLHAAEYEARAALALDPDLGLVHYAAAIVNKAQRRFKSAENHLLMAISLEPHNSAWLRELAELYLLWDKPAQVMPLLERARDNDPEDADTWAALSNAFQQQRKPAEAEQCARRGLELDPENSNALLAMGNVLLQAGNIDDAREHAVMVLRNNAANGSAMVLLAQAKARKSLLLGLWWRFNSFLGNGTMSRRVVWLVGLYLVYRIVVLAMNDAGNSSAAQSFQLVWLGFCVYTWIGPAIFQRQLQRELSPTRLKSSF